MNFDILKISKQVADELVSAWSGEGGAFIRTPVLYPGGTTVVVRIESTGSQFLVSDMGGGYREADLMCASDLYSRHAKKVAKFYEVKFDGHSLFVLQVERDRLAAAVATIAACSQEAVQHLSHRLASKRVKGIDDRLYDRLVHVFSRHKVERGPRIRGATGNLHKFSSLVLADGNKIIYEPVSTNLSSINSAVTRFYDVSLLDEAPKRVAYVRDKNAFGPKLTLVSAVASVIQEDVSDDIIERLAAAA